MSAVSAATVTLVGRRFAKNRAQVLHCLGYASAWPQRRGNNVDLDIEQILDKSFNFFRIGSYWD